MAETSFKIPYGRLWPLNEILKGSNDPNSTRQLTEAATQVLAQLEHALQKQQVHYIHYGQPWQARISPTKLTPTAVLWLIWIHLPISPVKVLLPYFEAVAC